MNSIARQVERVLSEAVGEFLARAMLRKNCELIGTTPETLTAAQLPELSEKIEKSVSFCSGKDMGRTIARKIAALKD